MRKLKLFSLRASLAHFVKGAGRHVQNNLRKPTLVKSEERRDGKRGFNIYKNKKSTVGCFAF